MSLSTLSAERMQLNALFAERIQIKAFVAKHPEMNTNFLWMLWEIRVRAALRNVQTQIASNNEKLSHVRRIVCNKKTERPSNPTFKVTDNATYTVAEPRKYIMTIRRPQRQDEKCKIQARELKEQLELLIRSHDSSKMRKDGDPVTGPAAILYSKLSPAAKKFIPAVSKTSSHLATADGKPASSVSSTISKCCGPDTPFALTLVPIMVKQFNAMVLNHNNKSGSRSDSPYTMIFAAISNGGPISFFYAAMQQYTLRAPKRSNTKSRPSYKPYISSTINYASISDRGSESYFYANISERAHLNPLASAFVPSTSSSNPSSTRSIFPKVTNGGLASFVYAILAIIYAVITKCRRSLNPLAAAFAPRKTATRTSHLNACAAEFIPLADAVEGYDRICPYGEYALEALSDMEDVQFDHVDCDCNHYSDHSDYIYYSDCEDSDSSVDSSDLCCRGGCGGCDVYCVF